MRRFLILFFLTISGTITAQADAFFGIYIYQEEADTGVLQHKMVLDEEGTFLFSTFFSPKDMDGKMLEIQSDYGSGKWRVNGNQLFFLVDPKVDFDEDRTLDFSKTRARLEKPAPSKPKVDKDPVSLVFFDSDISWVKGLKFQRQ